jgi:hypothetical protein
VNHGTSDSILRRKNQQGNGEINLKNILSFFLSKNKDRVRALINFIQKDNIISWNKKGEFIFKGDVILNI